MMKSIFVLLQLFSVLERFSYDVEKWFCKCSLFVLSANGWKLKTQPLPFPAKETLIWRRQCSIGQWLLTQYDVKEKYRFISRKFLGHDIFSRKRSFNQSKATRVYIRSINQSNRSTSVRLLFLFCSRVFISKSYKNRPISLLCYSIWWLPPSATKRNYCLPFTIYVHLYKAWK